MTSTRRLLRAASPAQPPELDEDQRRVVGHPGGPLLVLAGPGTGKTTTLVESIVERIETRGAAPESVLALTFSRKAAEQLRDRVAARLRRTTSTTVCATFHSFAYGLLRRFAPEELYLAPLRLLSAPEQDGILRELLDSPPIAGQPAVRWPEALWHALGTRGFAKEVHAVLGRAREKGLDPEDLRRLGEEHGLPEFVAAGLFMEEYLTNLDSQGATDYADLIRRATIEAAAHRDELRAEFRHVFVDEYQDTDPGQVALLRQLAGDGRDLVVVGDPHQSIYAFRGADVRGILDFPRQFPDSAGLPAEVVVLGRTRRFGPRILAASQRVAGNLAWHGSIGQEARTAFAAPVCVPGAAPDGRVEVLTFDSERAESEHLADRLRRAHLEDGVAWHDMAVLVRSGRTTLPGLRRSLAAAGVPVEVAADEVPLVRDPAVQPLLDALRAVLNLDNADPEHVDHVDAGRAEALLLGPLAGLDAGEVRRLGRLLRQREKVRVLGSGERHRTSRELVRLAVLDATFLTGGPDPLHGPEVEKAAAFSGLLAAARSAADAGADAAEVLWTLWSGTEWPARLRRTAEGNGPGSGRAHRDLDSLCALFEEAARTEEQRDHTSVGNFLATLRAQEIPADTLAERGLRGSAVRLLTAHRSKGLEWRLVVVAHVQQGGWPDLRRRSTLLGADRIGAGDLEPPTSVRELLAEERRLFYVACTRARERLLVTAVASPDEEGEQPSRFLAELGLDPVAILGRPARPLSLPGVVAELRRTVTDAEASPALRDAAARRLARLAAQTTAGGTRSLVPQADPASWWGTRSRSRSVVPVRPVDEPVPISASLLESVLVCPTQWFLTREAGGIAASHQAASVGQLVHALAERVARSELGTDPDPATALADLMAQVDLVWDRLEFRTPWSRAREYGRIRAALERFLAWHRDDPRTLLGVEQSFSAEVVLADGERVRLNGYADRLELDSDGRVVVVDLKTGRTPPTKPAVERNVQLALYQYAVDNGAVDALAPGQQLVAGGAELVQLGVLDDNPRAIVQEQPASAPSGPEREQLRGALADAARLLRTEVFPAVAGPHCERCAFVALCPIKSAGAVLG